MSEPPRLAYVHIGKSAGTWLRSELQRCYPSNEVCDYRFQHQFYQDEDGSYMGKRFFSAHIGGQFALSLDAALVTVLRNPFDRIVSLFYYWKTVDGGPEYVKDLTLELFLTNLVERSIVDVLNTQAWQIAFGHMPEDRYRYAGLSKDELFEAAVSRLDQFEVVGVYEDLGDVRAQLSEKLGLSIGSPSAGRLNVTAARRDVAELTIKERGLIYALADVDLALYERVAKSVR